MTSTELAIEKHFNWKDFLSQFQWYVLLAAAFTYLAYELGSKTHFVILLTLLPLLLFALYNFRVLLYILPVLFFINLNVSVFSISELFVPVILFSFLVTHKNVQWDDFRFPAGKIFLLYLTVLLLSVIKSSNQLLALVAINHFIFFLLFIGVLYAAVKETDTIVKIINVYLAALAVNTVHVIIQAVLTGKRVFGFAGVMYVDYVGVGIIFCVVSTFFSKTVIRKVLYGSLVLFYTIGLILTQTRTSWIASAITVLVVYGFMGWKREYFYLNGKGFKRLSAAFLIIISLGIFSAAVFNPNTFSRVAEIDQPTQEHVTEEGKVSNSLVSRLFIWHTAYNAFIENPILGIGAYSFPFSSQYYYTINKILFKEYVSGLSPHQTFFAVAVETGIVGIIAFILLYLTLLNRIVKSILRYPAPADRQLGLILGAGIFYCMISMFTTDAWLWGHGIVLWGLLLGIFFAFDRKNSLPQNR